MNHRDEKSVFGAGDAQVRNDKSVSRHPAFAVAVYSMMLMAAFEAYGVQRTEAYLPLPKWRGKARRPSCADTPSRTETNNFPPQSPRLREFSSSLAR